MSNYEEAEADQQETRQLYEDLRRRLIASGGDARQFDGLHLRAAAVRRSEGRIDDLARTTRGGVDRPVTQHEIRQSLRTLMDEATEAHSAGRLGEFRKGLWPYGPPMDH